MENEGNEREIALQEIQDLTQTRDKLKHRLDSMNEQLNELNYQITYEKNILTQRRLQRDALIERASPECYLYEKYLGLLIIPIRHFVMKFVYSQIDKNSPSSTFSITIDVSNNDYKRNGRFFC